MIYLAFLGFFTVMLRRKAATAGQYPIARSLKFVARTSHMTNQRSKTSSLWFIDFGACMKNVNIGVLSMLQIPAASYLMELAAIDWFKDTKRMDNVARQKGCVAQVNNLVNANNLWFLVYYYTTSWEYNAYITFGTLLIRLLLRKGCIHLLSTYR